MPSKFLFEGEFDEVGVPLAVLVGVDDLCLLDRTTPTGITIANMRISMIPMMPGKAISNKFRAPSTKTHQFSSASVAALHPLQIQHYQHRLSVVLFDQPR